MELSEKLILSFIALSIWVFYFSMEKILFNTVSRKFFLPFLFFGVVIFAFFAEKSFFLFSFFHYL